MRRHYFALLVVFGFLFLGAAAVAAEALPEAEHPTSSVAVLVCAVLGALGVLDRLARLVWKYRRLVRIAFDVIERLAAQGSMDAGTMKSNIESETKDLPAEDRELVTKASSRAEKSTNRNGKATRALAEEPKALKVARFLGRFLPVVGRLF